MTPLPFSTTCAALQAAHVMGTMACERLGPAPPGTDLDVALACVTGDALAWSMDLATRPRWWPLAAARHAATQRKAAR